MTHSLPSKSSISISESLEYGDESYASLVGQQRLCQGSAADLFLVPKQQIQVVKKVMRVVPTYFGGEVTSSGQGSLDQIRASFSKTFGRWCLLEKPHACIIEMFFVDTKELTLYKEYCINGNLRQYSKQIQSALECDKILRDITGGLAYLHSQTPPIVHGCINPGNIYVTGDLTVKLGEPSCSQLVVEFSHLTPSINVDWLVRWMSPEFFEGEPLTTQSDIWSLGCTFLEIITGRLPYYQFKSNTEVLNQILLDVSPDLGESFKSPREGLGKSYAETARQLANECWLPALDRPTIQDFQEMQEELSDDILKSRQATPQGPSMWLVTSNALSKAGGEEKSSRGISAQQQPWIGYYAAGSSEPYKTDSDAPQWQVGKFQHHDEVSHERSPLRSRKYPVLRSSNWLEQLNIWSDRLGIRHINFITDLRIGALWQAIPIFPAITRGGTGVLYGRYAPLNDNAVIGHGRSKKEAIEDSARKLLELDYCYY